MALIEVKMPQLGESVHEGTIGKWLKKVGEPVKKYEPLLEVITDKVDTEVTATDSGIVQEILVAEGETVKVGTVLARLAPEGEPALKPNGGVPATAAQAEITAPPMAETPRAARISPVVARIADEHGVDLSQVRGTGIGGRITKEDVLRYVVEREQQKAQPAAAPAGGIAVEQLPQPEHAGETWISPVVARLAAQYQVDLSQVKGTGHQGRVTKQDILTYVEQRKVAPAVAPAAAPTTPPTMPSPARIEVAVRPGDQVEKLTPMRKAIAEHMVRSLQTAAQVTTVMEADLSRVVALREQHKHEFQQREGFNLTYTPFFVQAAVTALRAHPMANSSFGDDQIVLKRQINIGIAVALEDGLIVPVIKNADEKSLLRLAREVHDLATRARDHRLSPDDVQGATFTITNHGVSGSLFATPIINQPNAAILGIGAIQKRVVVTPDNAIAIRPMCYLSLTFDHRIMDGVAADHFLAKIVEELERGDFRL